MARVLGIDPGEARTGVAISDELGFLAHPLTTLDSRAGGLAGRIRKLAVERGAGTVVVGIPRNMDGSYGPAAAKSREIIEELRSEPGLVVEGWDERLSTVAASRALRESGLDARRQRGVIDRAAAQIILQGWLDSRSCV